MQVYSNTSGDSDVVVSDEMTSSFVDWSAIIAGALTAAAVSLVLLFLGSGLGFASVSPWARAGASLTTFTVEAAIWLIIMQWLSSALGGYITGRLRSKWVDMHGDEVFFRDTAQGLLTWVIATLVTAAFLASASAAIIGGGVKAAATVGAGMAAAPNSPSAQAGPLGTAPDPQWENGYLIDTLFRPDHINPAPNDSPAPNPSVVTPEVRGEVNRILLNGIKNDTFPEADKTYLALVVAARTGVSTDEAARRVDVVVTQIEDIKKKVKQNADATRKAASMLAIMTCLSLVVGAFVASVAAALGGKKRDTFE